MYANSPRYTDSSRPDPKLFVAIGLMALAGLSGLVMIGASSDLFEKFPYLFLFPWLIVLAVILAVPVILAARQGSEGFANPLVIAALTYFFPAFVLGGASLSVGLSTPYFLSFVQDTTETFTYCIILVILGFGSLAIGFYLPFARKTGAYIADKLPKFGSPGESYLIPGLFLLCLGILNTGLATVAGVVGYQRAESIGLFDGLIFLSTLFSLQGRFLLWSVVFRAEKLRPIHWIVMLVLITVSLVTAAFAGNRGSLLSSIIVIGLAYLLSGKKITMKKAVAGSFVAVFAIMAGMVYGTKFRENLGSQSKTDFGVYTESIGSAIGQIAEGNNLENLEYGFVNLAERLDILSSLAVVVSNHEQLAPYEESYGLDNNILKDTATLLIPRVVWADKPVASDPRAYSELYFNQGDNAFAITPIGDLLRNFGPYGVIAGMLLLGFVLRIIYRSLVEGQADSLWRKCLYFMLVSSVSYEAFYGSMLPMLVKVGITAVIGVLIAEFIAHRMTGRNTASPTTMKGQFSAG